MKKLIAMLLVLVMVVALGTTAFADDAKVGETVLKCAFNQTITNPEAQTLLKISDDLYDATEGSLSRCLSRRSGPDSGERHDRRP